MGYPTMVFLLNIHLKSFVPQVTPDREASVPTTNLLYSLPPPPNPVTKHPGILGYNEKMKSTNNRKRGRGRNPGQRHTHTQTFF